MGIYGSFAKKLVENQFANLAEQVTIEIYVNHDLYEQLLEEKIQTVLQENLRANLTLTDKDSSIRIMVRDANTLTSSGGKGPHGCSIKVTEPKSIVKKGVDIIVPGFKKTGEAPYPGAKVPGISNTNQAYVDTNVEDNIKVGKSYPNEIKLAIKFATEYKKQLNLIFYKPENEANQIKLFEEILTKCDYIEKCSIGSKEESKPILDKVNRKRKKEIKYGK